MSFVRQRLLAKRGDEEPIELWRGDDSKPRLEEKQLVSYVCNLGVGWVHWIEKPMPDSHMIGRLASFDAVVVQSRIDRAIQEGSVGENCALHED